MFESRKHIVVPALVCLAVAGCGGGGGSGGGVESGSSSSASYTLAGSISGLTTSGLVLSNADSTLSVAASATKFSFGTATGAYSISIVSQPDGQTCSVSNGSGTMTASVSNVIIVCRYYMAYVSNSGSNTLAQFSVASGTGLLTALATPTVSTA